MTSAKHSPRTAPDCRACSGTGAFADDASPSASVHGCDACGGTGIAPCACCLDGSPAVGRIGSSPACQVCLDTDAQHERPVAIEFRAYVAGLAGLAGPLGRLVHGPLVDRWQATARGAR